MVTRKPTTPTKAHLPTPPELAGYFPHRLPAAPAQPSARTHYRPRGPDPLRRLFRRRFPEFRTAYEQRYAPTFGRFRLPLIVRAASAFRVCGDWSQGIARIAATVFRGIQVPHARLRPVPTLLLQELPPLPLVRPEKNPPGRRVPQREPAAAPAPPTGGAVARHSVRLDDTQSPTNVPPSRPDRRSGSDPQDHRLHGASRSRTASAELIGQPDRVPMGRRCFLVRRRRSGGRW